MNALTLNWEANLKFYKCREKGHLVSECPHRITLVINQKHQTPIANTQQATYSGSTLFPGTNPTLSQTIPAETQITSEIWQTFMEQLSKVNQENKLLKRHIRIYISSTKSSSSCQGCPAKSGISN